MSSTYNLEPLILNGGDRLAARQYLAEAPFFDTSIMHQHDEALRVWRSVTRRYANKESKLDIPFTLAESPKLYALDALCIATPLVKSPQEIHVIAELFTVFYLIVHFFDDHVEHPDKFFSKFDFASDGDMNTQHGAAPFSFLLLSFSIINEILGEAKNLDDASRMRILGAMYDRLAIQTRHFTTERKSNLSIEEVVEMKARRVNGQTFGVLADILREFLDYDDKQYNQMQTGLLHLGAAEQFTDDIRDIAIDGALRNANIIISANRFGVEAGAKKVAKLYQEEVTQAKTALTAFYNAAELKAIESLPFYPFMVDKQQLEEERDLS